MFQGPTTGVIEQTAESIEVEHQKVSSGKKGQSIAIKVESVVRPRDKMFKIVDVDMP